MAPFHHRQVDKSIDEYLADAKGLMDAERELHLQLHLVGFVDANFASLICYPPTRGREDRLKRTAVLAGLLA
jgi:hypothetical protein